MTDPEYAAFKALDPFFGIVQQGLAGLVDGDHYFDTIADDAVFEFRYIFPGWPLKVNGRKALMELYAGYGGNIVLHSADALVTHRSQDLGVVILEYDVHGTVVRTGASYDNRFISVVTIEDRKIVGWRDYMDSLAAMNALNVEGSQMDESQEPASPEQITAWATAVLTILTAVGLILTMLTLKDTSESARRAIEAQEKVTSTTLLISLEERWNSDRMEESRKRLAKQLLDLLEKKDGALTLLDDMDTNVVDFFENVGYLTHKGSLNQRMVWNLFVWELSAYYTALARESKLIQEERKRDGHVAVYAELEWLYKQFDKIDKETNNKSKTSSKLVNLEMADLKKFLRREAKLWNDQSSADEETNSKKEEDDSKKSK